uniref:Uncharacterized protein n=1 Tax=Pipistrellus kuhlii TaxID=59472 RepID=A0A7J8B156_PIPKU|nr:hypothetical protein mPipKuh1_007744 [Pipistrellus kuhlii]
MFIFFLISLALKVVSVKILLWHISEIKSFCKAKEIIIKITKKPIAWENKFVSVISDKGLISNIYSEYIQLNKRKIKKPKTIKKWATDLNRCFKKKGIKEAKRHMKTCSKSIIIREMQIKTTMIPSHICQNCYHQQINKWQVLVMMQRKRNPRALPVGIQTGVATVENSMAFSQKTKNGTSI